MDKTPIPTNRPDLCLFISYSQVNMAEMQRLHKHLEPMAKRLNVELWHNEKIALGSNRKQAIAEKLAGMNIFLFLVSADSLASEFINEVEFIKALEESQKRKVDLIPILIQPCDWEAHDISNYQVLPRDGIAIASRAKPEEGYAEVAVELRKYIEEKYLRSPRQNTPSAETKSTQDVTDVNDSLKNEEPMYRESWKSQPSAGAGPLPLPQILKSLREVVEFRQQLSKLNENLAGFKPDLSRLLNQIATFLKELEGDLKESGNEGHRIFRLGLETQSKVSEIRKQLLIANTHSQKGLQALADLANRDLIYFDSSLENLETALKNDFGIKSN